MATISEVNTRSFLLQAGHFGLEAYSLVVRSAIKGVIETVALGSLFYFGQRFILRADMNASTPFEISKMIACSHFVDNLFQPLQDVILQIEKPTYEQLRKEVVYVVEPNWKKEALAVLLYSATFFPKAYSSFRIATFVGCLSETIESNKNSLLFAFYFFTAFRLFDYSKNHFRSLVESYRNPRYEPEPSLRIPSIKT